ncbi:MAG: hypothetical protein EOO65_05910, partial [Methanosarcinales archaeon]
MQCLNDAPSMSLVLPTSLMCPLTAETATTTNEEVHDMIAAGMALAPAPSNSSLQTSPTRATAQREAAHTHVQGAGSRYHSVVARGETAAALRQMGQKAVSSEEREDVQMLSEAVMGTEEERDAFHRRHPHAKAAASGDFLFHAPRTGLPHGSMSALHLPGASASASSDDESGGSDRGRGSGRGSGRGALSSAAGTAATRLPPPSSAASSSPEALDVTSPSVIARCVGDSETVAVASGTDSVPHERCSREGSSDTERLVSLPGRAEQSMDFLQKKSVGAPVSHVFGVLNSPDMHSPLPEWRTLTPGANVSHSLEA